MFSLVPVARWNYFSNRTARFDENEIVDGLKTFEVGGSKNKFGIDISYIKGGGGLKSFTII